MDGAFVEAFTYEEENLERFLEMSSGELNYFLQQRGLPVGGTHSSLPARALIAFEQKKSIITTAENLVKKLSEDYANLLKERCLCFDPNENLLMSDDLKQFPKTNIGQVFSFILKQNHSVQSILGNIKLKKHILITKVNLLIKSRTFK